MSRFMFDNALVVDTAVNLRHRIELLVCDAAVCDDARSAPAPWRGAHNRLHRYQAGFISFLEFELVRYAYWHMVA